MILALYGPRIPRGIWKTWEIITLKPTFSVESSFYDSASRAVWINSSVTTLFNGLISWLCSHFGGSESWFKTDVRNITCLRRRWQRIVLSGQTNYRVTLESWTPASALGRLLFWSLIEFGLRCLLAFLSCLQNSVSVFHSHGTCSHQRSLNSQPACCATGKSSRWGSVWAFSDFCEISL